MPAALISRRSLLCCASAAWLLPAGCTASLFNSPEPIVEDIVDSDEPAKTIVIGDLTGTWGMKPFKVESIALVTGLDNTGSDPGPSPQRDILIGDMQAHQVASPNGVLASPRTSMVLVRALLPPGVRKGDRVDLELITPPRSETTSLKGGWLMPTRLKELAVLQGQLRSGHEHALGQGHVLVDAELAGGNEAVSLKRGKILGGGIALKSRPLGLACAANIRACGTVRSSARRSTADSACSTRRTSKRESPRRCATTTSNSKSIRDIATTFGDTCAWCRRFPFARLRSRRSTGSIHLAGNCLSRPRPPVRR